MDRMDKLLVEAARKLHAEELFEIVRKNYVEANREYLQKQISIASEYLTGQRPTTEAADLQERVQS